MKVRKYTNGAAALHSCCASHADSVNHCDNAKSKLLSCSTNVGFFNVQLAVHLDFVFTHEHDSRQHKRTADTRDCNIRKSQAEAASVMTTPDRTVRHMSPET